MLRTRPLLSVLVLAAAAVAQTPDCCQTGAKPAPAVANEQAKALAELQAKLQELPAAERTALAAAVRSTFDTAPWGQAAAAVSKALEAGVASFEKRGLCAAVPTGEGHTGEVDKLRGVQAKVLRNVAQTLSAQGTLVQSLLGQGGSCCTESTAKPEASACCNKATTKPAADAPAGACCKEAAQPGVAATHPTEAAGKLIAGMVAAYRQMSPATRTQLEVNTATLRKHGLDRALRKTFAYYEGQLEIAAASAGELVDVYAGAADAGCPVSGKNAEQHKDTQSDLGKYRQMLAAFRTALDQLGGE